MIKKVIIALVILGLALGQMRLWPLPLYYWLAGECTRGLLCLQGQNLLTISARGSWRSSGIKKWQLISSREVFALKTPRQKDEFLIVVFTPWDLNNLSYNARVAYVQKATKIAVAMGADLICDASAADRARQTEKDHASTRLLKKVGIARAVIFDGGHHLPNLALEPELLLCPVIGGPDKQTLVAHGFCRDALPLEELVRLKKLLRLNSTIITFPRFAGYLKAPRAMGTLLWQAVQLLEKSEPQKKLPMVHPLLWGPRFSLFTNGVLLWRPETHELEDLQGEIEKIQRKAQSSVEQAFVSIDGTGQLPENDRWELATVGLSSWQIILGRLWPQ